MESLLADDCVVNSFLTKFNGLRRLVFIILALSFDIIAQEKKSVVCHEYTKPQSIFDNEDNCQEYPYAGGNDSDPAQMVL